MLYIAIDLGSYSVKFLSYKMSKKQVKLEYSDEVVLDIAQESQVHEDHLWNTQIKTVKEYLSHINEEYQVMMNLTSEIISTRFLSIPGKNKRRAASIIPFQIEEDLPYPLADAHYAETIQVIDNNCEAVAGIVRRNHIESFYTLLNNADIAPKALTNDTSYFYSFVQSNLEFYPESFCILDIGHDATRGFYFYKGKLVSNHHSYIAGKAITENISATYNIDIEEASIYKHQNAFVLTDEQMENVNDNQKDFAKMMNHSLQILISDIKRWEIGHRVKHGSPVTNYFICGGSANIKNIPHYLQTHLKTTVQFFDPFKACNDKSFDKESKNRVRLGGAVAMAIAGKSKNDIINFLRGEFSLHGNIQLPLHNISYIGVRAALLSLLLVAGLLINNLFISSDLKVAKNRSSQLLKNQVFKFSGRELRTVLTASPKRILAKLNRQEKKIVQEIKVIQSSVKTNAIRSLNDLLEHIAGNDIEILQFISKSGGEFNVLLHAKELSLLEQLEKNFNEKNKKFFVELNKAQLTLSLSGEEGDL